MTRRQQRRTIVDENGAARYAPSRRFVAGCLVAICAIGYLTLYVLIRLARHSR